MARHAERITHWWGIRAGMVVLLLVCMGCGDSKKTLDRLAHRHRSVRQLYRVLAQYELDHGVLPSSSEGPDHALYMLEPYCASIFYMPYFSQDHLGLKPFEVENGELDMPPAAWDDYEQRVVNLAYDYFNEPRQLDRTQPVFAVYAEKVAEDSDGRWVVFCNGATLWVSSRNGLYQQVLGKSWKQLRRAEPKPVEQPVGVANWRLIQRFTGSQLAGIFFAMHDYASDHSGSLPFSERGPQAALYKLKAYLPDADIFDGIFTQLENGAAYWNDEKQRLENADFDYLNQPLSDERRPNPPVATLAGKWGADSQNRRWALFSDGTPNCIFRGSQSAEDPLGKTRDGLEVP